MNNFKTKTIFISYCWADFEIANILEKNLNVPGIDIVRDIKLEYKENIFDFMKRIKDEDFALLLLSDDYLKSENCMKEILEIIEDDFSKVLPIIVPKTKIFKPEDRLKIIKYWENKIETLNASIRELNSLANIPETIATLTIYQKIRDSIDRFISKIIQLNCKDYQELLDKNFKPILDHIGILDVDFLSETIRISNIKNYEEREIAIEKELTINPKNINLIFLKANLAFEENKFEKAKRLYQELIKDNKYPQIYNNLGVCYQKQGLINEALNEFRNAIELDTRFSEAYKNIGMIFHYDYKNYKEAEKNYLECILIDYSSYWVHYNLANLYHDIGNYSKAEFHYEDALIFLPTEFQDDIETSSIYYNFANLLHDHLGKFDKAKLNYLICIQLNADNFKARCNLANLLISEFKDYNEGEKQYKEALKIQPKDSFTLYNLANLYLLLKNEILAEHYFLKAIEYDDGYLNSFNSFESYNQLGLIYLSKNIEKAKEYLEKAIEINPNFAFANYNLARLYKQNLNDSELAKKYYLIAIKKDFRLYTKENNKLFNLKVLEINNVPNVQNLPK